MIPLGLIVEFDFYFRLFMTSQFQEQIFNFRRRREPLASAGEVREHRGGLCTPTSWILCTVVPG